MGKQQRILFVDDEESIRATLPPLLESNGFVVTAARSVPEALQLISEQRFEVLISDLNIGSPGDGFTIVSAMRRTQPEAVTLILTGYPAFESALEAIRRQVDEYLVKPTDIDLLVTTIRSKLAGPIRPPSSIQMRPLPEIIEDNQNWIIEHWLAAVKKDAEISSLPLSDRERTDHIPRLLAESLAKVRTKQSRAEAARAARLHGPTRREQGYTLPLVIREAGLLETVIGKCVEENLLAIELSHLIPDMIQLWESIQSHLEISVEAFLEPHAGTKPSIVKAQPKGGRRK